MKPDLFNEPSEAVLLASPRFDDERTLQSARAVVPLARVESKSRIKRWLSLLGTAVLGGTVTAVILLQFGRIRTDNRVNTQNSTEATRGESTSSLTAGKDETSAAIAKPAQPSTAEEPQPAQDNAASATKGQRRKKSAIADSSANPTVGENRTVGDRDDPSIDVWTRDEWRREARRAERRAEREERARERGDDLFRIRDIFEGSRRP
ncbi:MAG TPA: hypothetical protein VIV66_02635 [Pyrinomonadaceae bacterium]